MEQLPHLKFAVKNEGKPSYQQVPIKKDPRTERNIKNRCGHSDNLSLNVSKIRD